MSSSWGAGFGGDTIGISILSWSDTSITVNGFGGAGVSTNPTGGQYPIQPGDHIYIYVVGPNCNSGGWGPGFEGNPPPLSTWPAACTSFAESTVTGTPNGITLYPDCSTSASTPFGLETNPIDGPPSTLAGCTDASGTLSFVGTYTGATPITVSNLGLTLYYTAPDTGTTDIVYQLLDNGQPGCSPITPGGCSGSQIIFGDDSGSLNVIRTTSCSNPEVPYNDNYPISGATIQPGDQIELDVTWNSANAGQICTGPIYDPLYSSVFITAQSVFPAPEFPLGALLSIIAPLAALLIYFVAKPRITGRKTI